MGKDYFPDRERDIVEWTRTFGSVLASDPKSFGISEEESAQYLILQQAFEASYTRTQVPLTRTRPANEQKRVDLKALEKETRRLVRIIQATPIDGAMKERLQLSVARPGGDRRPLGVPMSPPVIHVRRCLAREVAIQLRNMDATGRARPRGVIGALILRSLEPEPPVSASQWDVHDLTTETNYTLHFRSDIPNGALVWISAQWLSPKLERGPGAAPICTNVIGGVGRGREIARLRAA